MASTLNPHYENSDAFVQSLRHDPTLLDHVGSVGVGSFLTLYSRYYSSSWSSVVLALRNVLLPPDGSSVNLVQALPQLQDVSESLLPVLPADVFVRFANHLSIVAKTHEWAQRAFSQPDVDIPELDHISEFSESSPAYFMTYTEHLSQLMALALYENPPPLPLTPDNMAGLLEHPRWNDYATALRKVSAPQFNTAIAMLKDLLVAVDTNIKYDQLNEIAITTRQNNIQTIALPKPPSL